MTARWCATAALLLAAGLAACGVTSEHPLSDERSSVVDARLVGWWAYAPEDGTRVAALVGRRPGSETVLRAAWITLDEHDEIEVHQIDIFATTLGEERYVSLRGAGAGFDGEDYALALYELDGSDVLRIYPLDRAAVGAALERGAIEGELGQVDESGETPHRLTAPTEALRAWIGERGRKLFDRSEALELTRVHAPKAARPKGEAAGPEGSR